MIFGLVDRDIGIFSSFSFGVEKVVLKVIDHLWFICTWGMKDVYTEFEGWSLIS